jgi:PAT family beta-lactamase induction signal transducer AmpG
MRASNSAPPFAFLFLALPCGISIGFVTVTLPFLLVGAGFSVALSMAIVATGASANIWRFVWGPLADVTLTLRKWYLIGVSACAATLLALSFMPLKPTATVALMTVAFLSQVAATLVLLPLGGMMANSVTPEAKGRAAGWYQSGSFAGISLGGGGGIWLANHLSVRLSGVFLCLAMIPSLSSLRFVPRTDRKLLETFAQRMRMIFLEFREMITSPMPALTILLVASPIGISAASNLFSGIAPEWKVKPDMVALVTGVLSGAIGALGSVAGGWMADRFGRWWLFFGSGAFSSVVAVGMAAAPRTTASFTISVLAYSLAFGIANAAFTAIVLAAVGNGAASTKYATLASIGNIPAAYMTAFDGWFHDRSGTAVMLYAEAALGLVCVAAGLCALGWITRQAASAPVNPGHGPDSSR